MLEKSEAQKLSKKLKIDLFTVQREYLQLLFLKRFYSKKEIQNIFFKGGTALRLLFDSFRFSEDLDFTSQVTEEKISKIIKETVKELKEEIPSLTFKEEKTKRSDSFKGRLFQDLERIDFPLTIRLDFSFRESPQTKEVSLIETQFPVSPYPQVVHLGLEEILAEKIRALSVRSRGRDIFDLWFILSKGVSIDWELVEKKMEIYEDKQASSKILKKKIRNISQKQIENDLAKFLPSSHRNLVEEIKHLALEKIEGQ